MRCRGVNVLTVPLRRDFKFCYDLLRTVTFCCVHPVLLRPLRFLIRAVTAVLNFWQFNNLVRHARHLWPATFAHPVPSRCLTSIPFWPRWHETWLSWPPGTWCKRSIWPTRHTETALRFKVSEECVCETATPGLVKLLGKKNMITIIILPNCIQQFTFVRLLGLCVMGLHSWVETITAKKNNTFPYPCGRWGSGC